MGSCTDCHYRFCCDTLWPAFIASGLLIGGISIYQQKTHLFAISTTHISRLFYDGNPFPEAIEIGKYIKEHSGPNDKIAVLGSEPEIFFYADRLSATSFIYTYPLMETHEFAHQMQTQMIREIETAKPEWLVFVHIQTSWLMSPDSNLEILKWSSDYARNFYRVTGILEIFPDRSATVSWGDKATDHKLNHKNWVGIFRRTH